MDKKSVFTIIVIILAIMMGISFLIMSTKLETEFTPEEKSYWDNNNKILSEAFTKTLELPDKVTPPHSGENPTRYALGVAELYETVPRQYLMKLQNQTPPLLFKEYHRQVLDMWESTCVLLEEMARYFRGPITQQWLDESEVKAELFSMKLEALNSTYEGLIEREIEKINDTLRERRSNVQLKSSIALSFHPYIVPVSIRIDSDGHVELASVTSLPTPIGVFVLEATVAVEDTPILTIIYNGEKHIYSMGTELYAFELPEYDGRITIKYDGKGNVTILLE